MSYRHLRLLRSRLQRRTLLAATVAGFLGLLSPAASAQLSWDQNGAGTLGGTGTWDNATTLNWWNGLADVAWNDPSNVTLAATFGGASGTVNVTGPLTANSLTFNTGGYILNGTGLTLGGAATIGVTNALDTATINTVLDGAAGLTYSGLGTLVLGGNNATLAGSINVNGGVLSISADNNLGVAANGVSINGGTLRSTGAAVTSARVVTLGASGGTIDVTGTNALTISGAIAANANALTKTGTGTLNLSTASTRTGTTLINGGGKLAVTNVSALGTGTVTVDGASSVYEINTTAATSTTAVTINNGGTFQWTQNAQLTVGTGKTIAVTGTGGTIFVGGTGSTGKVLAAAGLLTSTSGSVLTKTGTGVLQLSGANTGFLGNLAITAGTVEFQNVDTLSATARTVTVSGTGDFATGGVTNRNNVVMSGGILSANNTAAVYSGSISATAATTSTIALRQFQTTTAANSFAISGPISGSGNLNVTAPAAATLTLSGNNSTYSGTLAAGANATIQFNNITSGTSLPTSGNIAVGGTGSNLVVRQASTTSLTAGVNGLNATYFNFTSNSNPGVASTQFFTDTLWTNPRAFSRIDATANIPNSTVGDFPVIPVTGFATQTTAGAINDGVMWKGLLNITTAGNYQFSGIDDDALQLWIDGQSIGTLGVTATNANIGAAVALTAGPHSIVIKHTNGTGGGYAAVSYNGPDTASATQILGATPGSVTTGSMTPVSLGGIILNVGGGTLDIANDSTATSFTSTASATLTVTSPTSSSLNITGASSLFGGTTTTLSVAGAPVTFSGSVGQSAANGALTIQGGGQVTFASPTGNTYTGTTTVSAGQLVLNGGATTIGGNLAISATNVAPLNNVVLAQSNQIADTSNVTLSNSGTISIGANSDTINQLNMSGNSLVVGTSGVLTVSNLGTSTITGGRVSANLAGAGGLNFGTANGTFILTGNNAYTGVTAITNGNLIAGSANALGAGGAGNGTTVSGSGQLNLLGTFAGGTELVTINNAAGLRSLGGNTGLASTVTLGTDSTITVNSGSLSLSNATASIDGSAVNANLTVAGGGDLILGSAPTLGAGSITKNGTGALVFGYNVGATIPTVTFNSGSLGFSGPQSFGAVAVPTNRAYAFNTDPGAGAGPITVGSSSAVIANFAANQAFLNKLDGSSTGSLALGVNSANNLDFTASTASLGATGMVVYSGTITPNAGGYRLGGGAGYGYNLQDRLTITQALSGSNGLTIGSGNTNLTQTVNTFTGAVTVDGGAVVFTNSSSLGDSTSVANANITLQNGGILRMAQASNSVGANTGAGNGAAATFSMFGRNIPGGVQSARGLTIGTGGGTIDVPAQAADTNRLVIPGVVTGNAGTTLTKTGLGSAALASASTFAGDVVIAPQGGNLILASNASMLNVPTVTVGQSGAFVLDNHYGLGPNRNGGIVSANINRFNDSGTINLAGGLLLHLNQGALTSQSETVGKINLANGQNQIALTVSGNGPANGSFTLQTTDWTRSTGGLVRFGGNATYGAALAANVGRVMITNDVAALGASTRTTVPYVTMFNNDLAQYGANGFATAAYTTQAAGAFAPVAGTNYQINSAATATLSNAVNELSGFKFAGNFAETLAFTTGTEFLYVDSGPEGGAIIADDNNQARTIGSATLRGNLTAGPAVGNATARELFIYSNQNTTTINSNIVDNNGQAVALVKGLGGTVALTSLANTYSGGTYINGGRINVTGAGGLGTGAATVKNGALQLGAPGGSTGAGVASNLPVYSGIDQSEIYLQNATGVYNLASDRYSIAAGSVLTGESDTAAQGLNSLTRISSPTGFSGGGQVYLAPGSIIRTSAFTANVDISRNNMVNNLGTDADLYLNLNAGLTENTSVTIGAGTPWRGFAAGRVNSIFNSGTIYANSDFELQGTAFNGGVGTVTLGAAANAGGYSIVNLAGKPINAIVSGQVILSEDSPVIMPNDLTFVVTNGGLLQPNYTNSFGSGANAAKLVVQAGGTVDPGNYTGIGTAANQAVGFVYPIAGPMSMTSATFEAGGRLIINDASGIGTAAANSLIMKTGSIMELGNAQAFLGANAGLINSNQFAFDPGVIVRYATDNVYKFQDFVLGATNGSSATVLISGASRGLTTQVNPFTTLTEAQVLTFGNGGVLTNDQVDSRAVNGGGFGGRLVFNTGSTIAASTSGYFNVGEDIEVPAGQTVNIGTANYIDGTTKLGGVQLNASFNRIVGDLVIADGAELSFQNINVYPDTKSLNLGFAVTNLVGGGILPGTGSSLLINNTTAEVMGALTGDGAVIGNSNPSQLYTGFGGANYTFNGVVSSTGAQQVNFGKVGSGTMTLTGVSTSTGTLHVAAGQVTYSGSGASVYATNTASKGGTLTLDNTATPLGNRLGGTTKNVSLLGGELKFIGNATSPVTESLGTLNLTATGVGGIGIVTVDPNGSTDATTGVTFATFGTSVAANTGLTHVFRGPGLANPPGTTAISGTVTPAANLPGSIIGTATNMWSQANSNANPNSGAGVNGGGFIAGSVGTPLVPVRVDILGDTSLTGTGIGFVTQDTTTSGVRLLAASEYTGTIIPIYTQATNARLTGATNLAPSDTRVMSLTMTNGSSITMTGNQPFSVNPGRLMVTSGGIMVPTGASAAISVPYLVTSATNVAYLFQSQGNLALNTELVSGGITGIIKNGSGTLTLGNRAINNMIGQVTVNEGSVVLGGTSNTLYVAQPGAAAFNYIGQRVSLNGGTLDLNGKSQVFSDLLSNNTLNSSSSTNGTVAGTLTSATPATVTVQANAGTNNFGGQITGAISLNVTGSSGTARTLNLAEDNTFTGTTTVRGSTLRLTDDGKLSGTTAIDVNTGTLALDNFGTASMNNRIPAATPVTLRSGTLSLVGGPTAVSQTLNTVNAAQGTSNLNVNAGNSTQAELNVGNLVRTTGATVTFSSGSGTLGNAGSTFTNPRIFITNVNGNALALNDGILGGWATDGTNFISYNANGVGALNNLTGGFANYNSTDLSTATATQNVNDGTSRTITASKTVNSFRMNAGAAQTIGINNGVALNIDSGGILSNANQAMTFTGAQGTLTAGVADAIPDELFINAAQNTTTLGVSITDNGAAATSLVKSLGGALTLNPGVSTSAVTNTSGATTLTAVANPGIFAVGQTITGTGIQAGTTITDITGTTITISQVTTAAVTAITFDNPAIGNTYTGGTFVNGGTLNLSKAGLTGSGAFNVPGDLTINNGGIVAVTQPNQIAPTGAITLNGNGTFRITATAGWAYTMANQITLNGNGGAAQVTFGGGSTAGTLTLTNPNPFVVDNDNITVETVMSSGNIGNFIFAPSSGTTSTINVGGDSPFGTISNANITGVPTGGLIKTGSGFIALGPGGSTYGSPGVLTQVWDIQAGALRADTASALGPINAQTKVSAGGTLLLAGNAVTQTGSVNLAGGVLGVTVANNNISGGVDVSAASTINVAEYFQGATGRTMTLSGVVSGSSGLTLAGPAAPGTVGVLALSNTGNTYSGTINVVNNTTLRNAPTASGNALGTATINLAGGTLDLRSDAAQSFATSVVNLTAGSTINVDRVAAGTGIQHSIGTLNVTGTQALNVTAGNTYTLAIGNVAGTGTLVKRGQVATTVAAIDPTMTLSFSAPVGRSIAPTFNTSAAQNVIFTPASVTLANLSMPGIYTTPGGKTLSVTGATTIEANAENNPGVLGVTNTTTFSTGTLVNNGQVGAIGGAATVTAATGISGSGLYATSGQQLNLAGNFTSGTLKTAGDNTVNLTGTTNTFSGGAQVQSGTLKLTPTAAATSSGSITVYGSPSSVASGTTAPIAAVSGTLLFDGTSGTINHTGNVANSGLVRASAGTTTVSGAISGTTLGYTPGLLEGVLLPGNGVVDFTAGRTANPGNMGVKLEPRMGQTNVVTDSVLTGWVGNNHWVYTGYIKDDDGIFSLAENIDDSVGIWIDGTLVLQNSTFNTVTSTAYAAGQNGNTSSTGANAAAPSQNFGPGITLPGYGSGWHLIEIRMANGGGGAGPVAGNGFAANYGLGYKNGIGALDGADYIKPIDNGSGNLFVTPVGGKGNITVDSAATLSAGGFNLTSNTNFGTLATAGTSTFNVTANALPGGNDTDNLSVIAPTTGTNIGQLNLAASTVTTVNTATTVPASTNLNVGVSGVSGGRLVLPATSTLALNGGLNITGSGPASGPTVIVNVPSANSTGTGATIVATGGILGGSGSLPTGGTLDISAGGTLSPGNSPGILGAGNTTWSTNGNYNWQILDATGAAGTGFDQFAVNGTLTVGAGFNFNLWSLSSTGPDVNGNAVNFNNSLTQYWVVATTTGGGFTAGDLSGITLNTGATNGTGGFSNSTGGGTFSLIPGGGAAPGSANDVVLKFTANVTAGGPDVGVTAVGGGNLFVLRNASLSTASANVTLTNGNANTGTVSGFTTSNSNLTATTGQSIPAAPGTVNSTISLLSTATNQTALNSTVTYLTNPTDPNAADNTATVNVRIGNAPLHASSSSTTFGTSLIAATPISGTPYTDLASNTIGQTSTGTTVPALGSTATILAYTNSTGSDTGVSMAWRSRQAGEASIGETGTLPLGYLISDVVSLTGMTNVTGPNSAPRQTDTFVLEMSYNEALLNGFESVGAAGQKIFLAWRNSGGTWVNAVDGNIGGTPAFFNRDYVAGDENFLGRWGVDTANNTVWAVLNHNSDFAVIPEPSTLVFGGLALLGFAGVGIRRRRLAKQQA